MACARRNRLQAALDQIEVSERVPGGIRVRIGPHEVQLVVERPLDPVVIDLVPRDAGFHVVPARANQFSFRHARARFQPRAGQGNAG